MDIVVEAKKEYTKKLNNILLPHFTKYFDNLSSLQTDKREELRKIPIWNSAIVNTFVDDIKKDCSWLEELVTAVFISHVKILSSVKINDSKQTINLKVPECSLVIHNIFCNCSECIYYKLDLLPIQKEIMTEIIDHSIELSISELLPFENILAMYIKEQEEPEEEQEEEPVEEADEEEPEEEADEEEQEGSGAPEETNVEQDVEEEVPKPAAIEEDYTDLADSTKTVNLGTTQPTTQPQKPPPQRSDDEFF